MRRAQEKASNLPSDKNARRQRTQSGSIFLWLFAAVAIIGTVSFATSYIFRGPVAGMSKVTQYTIAQNNMMAARMLLAKMSMSATKPDCDIDGSIEPVAWRAGTVVPAGGGLLPSNLAVNLKDPWGTEYGYCTWDNGPKTIADNVLDCGGNTAMRLPGGNSINLMGVAVISAGPDKTFQTTCAAYNGSNAATLVTKPSGSDDIVQSSPYGEFLAMQTGGQKLDALPDEACNDKTVGIMRMVLGVVQICTDTGWTEVGTAATPDTSFINVVNATLNQQYTSNEITFNGFFNTRKLTVTGAATLVVDGIVTSAPAQIAAGKKISLRANAAATPETATEFSISFGGVVRKWTITTRDKYPAALAITPNPGNFTVTGPGSPSYSTPASFAVQNTGERPTNAMAYAVLSNTTNYEFYTNGSWIGDNCQGKILAPGDTCRLDIRAKATVNGAYTSTLTAQDGAVNVVGNLSTNASGWTCNLPWGGTIAHGQSVTAYSTTSVPYGSTCAAETRTCNAPTLSGSYQYQTCAPQAAANCSLPWGGTIAHGQSVTAWDKYNGSCYAGACNAQTRTCNNGTLSGSYGASSCSNPQAGSSCMGAGTHFRQGFDQYNSCGQHYNQCNICGCGTMSTCGCNYYEPACASSSAHCQGYSVYDGCTAFSYVTTCN